MLISLAGTENVAYGRCEFGLNRGLQQSFRLTKYDKGNFEYQDEKMSFI